MTTAALPRNAAVDLQEFLDERVYPHLFEQLPSAFPEFGWTRKGSAWVATSWPSGFPFHVDHEKPDRLMVYADRPYWIKVHGHSGLRLLDYVNGGRRPVGAEFVPAVRELALRADLDASLLDRPLTQEEEKRVRVREERRTVLRFVAEHAESVLWSEAGLAALDYLRVDRGLSDDEIRSLGLGLYLSVDETTVALGKAGVGIAEAKDAGALWSKLEGFIVIPWADSRGHPLTLYGRWPEKVPPLMLDHPGWQRQRDEERSRWEAKPEEDRTVVPWEEPRVSKTLGLPGAGSKASPLYLNRALAAGNQEVVLVEGVFDAAYLQVRGDTRAVASVAAQLSGEQVETLARAGVSRVFICGDPDGGGDRGTNANVESLSAAGIATYVVPRLPDGLDPDEFVRRDGIASWKARVEASVNGHVHLAAQVLGDVTPSSSDSVRDMATQRILGLVAGLDSEQFAAEEAEILRRTAKQVGRTVSVLAKQLKAERGRRPDAGGSSRRAGPSEDPSSGEGEHRPIDLLCRANGVPEANVANAITILAGDPRWVGVLAFDEFAQQVVVRRLPPYRALPAEIPEGGLPWRDEDDIESAAWLQREYRLNVHVDVVGDAAFAVATKNGYHPVREYLSGLAWDGRPRLEEWLTTYLRAEDTEYTRAVGKRWLIAAVARVFVPGCKADNVLTLEAAQGKGKSTSLKVLAGRWFTDELDAIGSKDAAVQLQGVWIVELAELDALGRAEISRTKAFISKSFDRFRPPYGRRAIRFDRQCVFAGTVNHRDYLKDETGNRRFWPVRCGAGADAVELDVASLQRDRDQLWAEAVVCYRRGEPWWLERSALVRLASDEQSSRFHADVWEPLIGAFVQDKASVSVGEVLLGLGVEVPRQGQVEQNRVARCLKALGWERAQRRERSGRAWRYYPLPAVPSPLRPSSPDDASPSGDASECAGPRPSPLSPVSPVGERNMEENDVSKRSKGEDPIHSSHREYVEAGGDSRDGGDTGDAHLPDEPRPATAHLCFVCGGRDFFPVPLGEPVCIRCHPPAFLAVH